MIFWDWSSLCGRKKSISHVVGCTFHVVVHTFHVVVRTFHVVGYRFLQVVRGKICGCEGKDVKTTLARYAVAAAGGYFNLAHFEAQLVGSHRPDGVKYFVIVTSDVRRS